MVKYRIAIQRVEGKKYFHVHNIVVETKSIKQLIKKIRSAIRSEIKARELLLIEWLHKRKPDYYSRLVKELDDDLVDWNSKGKDVSKEEFLENEIWFEVNE